LAKLANIHVLADTIWLTLFSFQRRFSSMIRYAIPLILILSFWLTGGALGAEREDEDTLLSEQDFLAEIPTVFAASRLPQAAADSPVVTTVLDRETIRASGARDLVELFRLVPGFVVGYAGAGRPVAAYHGLSGQFSQRMQVLLDGRSLYAPYLFGGIDWNTLPVNLDDIERVEVLRGSNSATYGANALLGMVNIITRTGSQSAGSYVSTSVGSMGIADIAARFGRQTSRGGWRLSAGRRSDSGLSQRFDDRQLSYANLQGEWHPNQQDEIKLAVGANRNTLGIGLPRNAGDPERYENGSSAFGQLQWRRSLAPDNEMSFGYSRTEDEGADQFFIPVTDKSGLLINYARHAVRNHLEYQQFFAVNNALRTSLGAEYDRESSSARQLFNTDAAQQRNMLRGYASMEWQPSDFWTLNAGGLVERDSLSGSHFAPRVVLNWKPDGINVFRAGYSQAFRTPSLFEQRSDWRFVYLGEPIDVRYLSRGGLKPEWAQVVELSYLGNWWRLGLALDARLFHERITGLITQQRYQLPEGTKLSIDDGAFDLRNEGDATLTGLESQLQWRPNASQSLRVGLHVTQPRASVAYLAESTPGYGAHALATQQLSGRRNVSLAYYRIAPVRWIGESSKVPGQQRVDMRLEQLFSLGKTRGSVSLIGQALNGGQAEFNSNQWLPRRGWLTLELEY
jgi:iron complex outermembrane receptor protein